MCYDNNDTILVNCRKEHFVMLKKYFPDLDLEIVALLTLPSICLDNLILTSPNLGNFKYLLLTSYMLLLLNNVV